MLNYILKRLGLAAITIFGVLLLIFVAARASGDVTLLMLPQDATDEMIAAFRAQHGLDQPVIVQFWQFLMGMLSGDFGTSLRYQRPAIEVILQRLPATLELTLSAFGLALVLGVTLGMLSAYWRGSLFDRVIRVVAIMLQSMPGFWIAIMAILVFAVTLGWLPTSGRSGFLSLIMPAVTLATFPLSGILRMTRSSILETIESEYVKFLRIKGVPESTILWRHALRNALIPVIALCGLQLGNLMGGAVITETIFNWPGLGSLMIESFVSRDYPVIQVGVLFIATLLILLNLAVDLLFCVVDPRIRYA
ncbi:ABC transporter permease [Pararhodobacter zhoushanensis]|uniref:ABC transporter permease n=1 Tax=Pararhodobacter zhoushanensis TaxID=2479545 RepID=A0ABT3GV65_9RHOB|nr:ABC transporter permease [Pararhodobacter zhoushanensis]MCW1931422.1 ABC transporter permease [Pararhodobacter zhoushanensis]